MDITQIYLGLADVAGNMGDPMFIEARDHVDSALLFIWVNLSERERDFVTTRMAATGKELA